MIKFPNVVVKADAWTRAPYTRMLPSRWWVMGYAGGQLILTGAGNPIPDQLATGPDPSIDRTRPEPTMRCRLTRG